MLYTTLIIAFRALRRNVLRSALTALGMIIGVGAVIVMVSIGQGARAQIEARMDALGRDLVVVYPASFQSAGVRSGWGTAGSLTPEDANAIAREIPLTDGVSPMSRTRAQVFGNGTNWSTMINGVSADYSYIREWPLVAGSFFSEQDVNTKAKVAVIGQTVMRQFGFTEPPLGQIIRIKRAPFKIIGVFAPRGFKSDGRDEDDVVMVPYTSYLTRVDRGDRLNYILLSARNDRVLDVVRGQIRDLLRQRHGLEDSAQLDFIVRTQEELTDAATATASTMTTLLGAIAGVSLLVGGIGIMNIMLVSVTERTREIGIRLAVGAHDTNVLMQFLAEAVLISLTGGLLGALLGIGCSYGIAHLKEWPVLVSSDSIIAALVFSAGIGIFFGYYPAWRAARLDPIEAIRHE